MTDLSKFQKFETKTIARSQLTDAPYNPRQIDDENRRKLRRALKEHGLVMPLVWNKRTGNLVAGHQRVSILDSLERSQDYTLTVAVIDVPVREEKLLNVQLNNPGLMGDWDADKLVALVKADDLDWVDELGFSIEDVNFLAGMDAVLDDEETDEMAEAKGKMTNIAELRAGVREKHRTTDKERTDYYFTVVCENPAHKEKLLAMLGMDERDDLVPGRAIERILRAIEHAYEDEDARDAALKEVDDAMGAPPAEDGEEDDDLDLEVPDDDE